MLCSISSQLWKFVPLIISFPETSFIYLFKYLGASSLMSTNILKKKEGKEKPFTLFLALLHLSPKTTLPCLYFFTTCSPLCSCYLPSSNREPL